MIESLRKTQIISLLDSQRLLGFLGRGDEVQKLFVQGSVQGKIVWNHLWEHRFSVPGPRVFPPPGDSFSAQTTENQIYNRACLERGSWVIIWSQWSLQSLRKKSSAMKSTETSYETKKLFPLILDDNTMEGSVCSSTSPSLHSNCAIFCDFSSAIFW